jgi:hypothetical protein
VVGDDVSGGHREFKLGFGARMHRASGTEARRRSREPRSPRLTDHSWPYRFRTVRHPFPIRELFAASFAPHRNRLSQFIPPERRPSVPNKRLQPDMSRLDIVERSSGVYLDGSPTNADPVGTHNIGWFLQPGKASSEEVCATVFARTSACETKVHIRGQLIVREVAK